MELALASLRRYFNDELERAIGPHDSAPAEPALLPTLRDTPAFSTALATGLNYLHVRQRSPT